ncbi:MAG TPA: response regulator transcription factor [Candidatus Acidoferrum sp.]|nr:response regulator transcription factor [Candidatus Acidoferrum sp.]
MQKRILVIDDSALVRGLVRKFIESRIGFEVCGEANDGLEGVEKGLKLKPDLIVLDYSMPRLNGLQTALMLHEVTPNSPIILYTLYKDVIPIREAQAAGVASIVSKCDNLATLADEVQRLTAGPN